MQHEFGVYMCMYMFMYQIHENIFKFYLWCTDDFRTDWLANLHKIGGAYELLLRSYLLAFILAMFRPLKGFFRWGLFFSSDPKSVCEKVIGTP